LNSHFPLLVGLRFFTSGSRNRLASFISALAISGLVLGIAMLIIVLSVMNGFDREMRTQILGVIPHIQLFGPADGGHRGFQQWQQVSEHLLEHPSVIAVSPFTQVEGIINFHGQTEAIQLRGVRLSRKDSAGGSAFDSILDPPLDTTLDPIAASLINIDSIADGEIILSRFLADKLTIEPGQKLAFIAPQAGIPNQSSRRSQLPTIRVFKVAGLFATHTAIDAHLGVVNLTAAAAMAGLVAESASASGQESVPAVQGLRVSVDDVFTARAVAFELLDQLPPGYSFVDWLQSHGNLYQAIQMSRKLVGLLVFLIIGIAAFNVVAMLVMTVINKRPDIAILKTQGASAGSILAIFLVQGAMIGLLGGALGAVLGCLGAWFVSDLVSWLQGVLHLQFLNLEIYPIDYVPSDLRFGDVGKVVLVALVLNLLATLYPAWQAARVQPASVLRYE
jgi:lipoprotein-releasing system permease protein